MDHEKYRSLEAALAIIVKKSKIHPSLTLNEIFGDLSGKGRAFILIFLSLPFCQPIQIPGLSIPFGIVIAFIGMRMAFGKHIWLPKKILLKKIPSKKVQKIAKIFLKVIKKVSKFIHPRMNWLCTHRAMEISNGLLIFLLGLALALPLPIPLTNIAAGWSICLLTLGILENDGVFVLIGYAISILTLIFFILLIFSIEQFF